MTTMNEHLVMAIVKADVDHFRMFCAEVIDMALSAPDLTDVRVVRAAKIARAVFKMTDGDKRWC